MFSVQRHRSLSVTSTRPSQEEEQQVEHDAEADDEVEGVLVEARTPGRHLPVHVTEESFSRETGCTKCPWCTDGARAVANVGGEVQLPDLDSLYRRAFLNAVIPAMKKITGSDHDVKIVGRLSV